MDYADFFSSVEHQEKYISTEPLNYLYQSQEKSIHFFLAGKLGSLSVEEFKLEFNKIKKIKMPWIAELIDFYISDKKEVWLGYEKVRGEMIKDNLKKKEDSLFSNNTAVIELFYKAKSIFEYFKGFGHDDLLFGSSCFLLDIEKNNIIFINWASYLLIPHNKKMINSMIITSLIFYTAIVERTVIHEFDVKKNFDHLDKKSFKDPLPENSHDNKQFNSDIISYLSNKIKILDHADDTVIDEFMSKISFRLSQRSFYPCLSEIYNDILENSEITNVNYTKIAVILLKDFSLSLFFFRKANLITEKKNGFIETLSKGLLYIGFQEVMNSLRSFASLHDLNIQDNKQEYTDFWVVTALQSYIAESIARSFSKPINIEFVRIISLLKNLGHFSIIYTMPELWKKTQSKTLLEGLGEDVASEKLMPLTFTRLSRQWAKNWKLHPIVIQSLEEQVPIKNNNLDEETSIRYITSLAYILARLVSTGFFKKPKEYVQEVIDLYSPALFFLEGDILDCIKSAVNKFLVDVHYDTLRSSDSLKRILFFQKYEFSKAYYAGADLFSSISSQESLHLNQNESEDRMLLFVESYKALQEMEVTERRKAFLRMIMEHYEFEDVLLLDNTNKSNILGIVNHVGHNPSVFNRFKIPALKTKDLFQTANTSGRPIYVSSITDPDIMSFVPAWYLSVSAYPPSFVYIPIKKSIQGKNITAFFLSKFRTHDLCLNNKEIQSIIKGFLDIGLN